MSASSVLFKNLRIPLILIALGAACAFAKPDRSEKHAGRFFAKIEKELGLTPEQSAQIKAILARDSAFSPYGGGGAVGHGKRAKRAKGCEGCAHCNVGNAGADGDDMGPWGPLSQQLRSASVDTTALNAGFEERVAAMRARRARRVSMFAEIHAVLTPGQRLQAAEILDKHRAEREKRCEKKCGKHCAR